MADSWEDEEFDVPSAVPPTSAPVSWEDEVRGLFCCESTHEIDTFCLVLFSCTHPYLINYSYQAY